ncbi:cytochrome b561 and DOMON domain-containing protein At3g61750 [Pistacia vera]|uniref:cytochrome b561 and DOMON domain-containing protein At3g61750 n=1 Tax=Pistacia vera TaxID=55513 RepID=UPI0012630A3C|nr:cytochrome b561 and DOMON domain-containing protein At3g61750 [Pistacia vera]
MANSRFQAHVSKILVGLYVFSLILEPKIFALAGDEGAAAATNSSEGNAGVSPQSKDDYIGGNGGNNGIEVSQLCNTDLQTFLPPPYGNISRMVCKPIWNTFILRYLKREDHVMTIILSAIYTTGWVGMGFSKDGMMAGSSAMVGWFNRKGQARIKQFFLQGTRPSQVIAGKGELPLANVPPVVVIHGAMIYLAFQLKFENSIGRQPIILAFGTRYPHHLHLTHHDDKRTIMFDFSGGSSSVLQVSSREKKNHGALGVIGWGLILPVGAIVPRYFKHKDPLWYYLHAIIQLLGFVFGLATVLLGIQLYDKLNVKNANIDAHRGIGIFILVLSILQILAFFLRPKKESKIRRYWNWYHNWFGRIALFFGAINIVLGIQIGYAGNEWKIGYGFLLAIILLAVIVLEALYWMKRSDQKATPSTFQMNPMQ